MKISCLVSIGVFVALLGGILPARGDNFGGPPACALSGGNACVMTGVIEMGSATNNVAPSISFNSQGPANNNGFEWSSSSGLITIANTGIFSSSEISWEDGYTGACIFPFILTASTGNILLGGSADSGPPCSAVTIGNGLIVGAPTGAAPTNGIINAEQVQVNGVSISALKGTTGSIGGSALLAGACASGTVTVIGATNGMVVVATPVTYPGAGFDWGRDYVSAANTVTVQVCADVAGTPTASAYNVRVIH